MYCAEIISKNVLNYKLKSVLEPPTFRVALSLKPINDKSIINDCIV